MTTPRKKNPAAVALGNLRAKYPYDETLRKRWENVSPEERTRHAKKAIAARWRKYRALKKAPRSA
jgi:hypothetical protein